MIKDIGVTQEDYGVKKFLKYSKNNWQTRDMTTVWIKKSREITTKYAG